MQFTKFHVLSTLSRAPTRGQENTSLRYYALTGVIRSANSQGGTTTTLNGTAKSYIFPSVVCKYNVNRQHQSVQTRNLHVLPHWLPRNWFPITASRATILNFVGLVSHPACDAFSTRVSVSHPTSGTPLLLGIFSAKLINMNSALAMNFADGDREAESRKSS
jgi:hypothetical protein